jgi:hypothetical protein
VRRKIQHVLIVVNSACFVEDPIAKRFTASPPKDLPENKDVATAKENVQSALEV